MGGMELRETKHLRAVGSHRFGVVGLVHMLEKSADEVAKRFPQSLLFVGDLSKRGGGDVDDEGGGRVGRGEEGSGDERRDRRGEERGGRMGSAVSSK